MLVRRSFVLGAAALSAAALAGCAQSGEGPAEGGTSGDSSAGPSGRSSSPGSASSGGIGAAAPPGEGQSVPAPTGDAGHTSSAAEAEQRAAARPVRLLVPAIGVDAESVDLDVTADGVLEVPTDFATVGWFVRSALPGERGPEIIAGHVDDQRGPAVFFRLRDLVAGDDITVVRADGATVLYRVDGVERYPKDAFPTAAVYGPAPGAVLRLITCGGAFDRSTRHYLDNTVVFATVAS